MIRQFEIVLITEPAGFSLWGIQPVLGPTSVDHGVHVPAEIAAGFKLVIKKSPQGQGKLNNQVGTNEQVFVQSHRGGCGSLSPLRVGGAIITGFGHGRLDEPGPSIRHGITSVLIGVVQKRALNGR